MKYLVFLLFGMVAAPLTAIASQMHPTLRGLAIAALVFSPAVGDMSNINFASMEEYRGPDRGYEIALTDIMAFGFLLYLLMEKADKILWWPLGSTPLALLFLVSVASSGGSAEPMIASFTMFKAMRIYFLFWVVANMVYTSEALPWMRRGWTALGLFSTFLMVKQKYGDGIYRIPLLFDHSNTVPLFLNLVCPVLVIWGMADRNLKSTEKTLTLFAGLGMAGCVTMTFSRAGTALSACAVAGAIAVGLMRNPKGSSFVTAGILGIIGLAGMAAVADSFIDRIKNAPESSAEARDEFNIAAEEMTKDYPIGVGPNLFSHTLTSVGKYREYLHVMAGEEQGGVAHHIYWLTAAELGWIGLGIFLLCMARWFFAGLWHGLASRTPEGLALTGLTIGAFAVHLQGFLEWALRITPVSQQFALCAGMVAGCVKLRKEQKQQRRWEKQQALLPREAPSPGVPAAA